MPDPKDFVPEGSTYVKGYVRGQPPTPKRKLKLRYIIFFGCIIIGFIILLIQVGLPALFGLLGAGVLWFIATHPPRRRKQGKKLTGNRKIDIL